jgi:hypothetical protein
LQARIFYKRFGDFDRDIEYTYFQYNIMARQAQLEVRLNLRGNSGKMMRQAAIKDKEFIISQWSFIVWRAGSSLRYNRIRLPSGANGSESQLDGYEVVSFVWTGLQTRPGER